ncbi:MAG TPA: MBOAT family O-acyltransferase [Acidobacteriota bacterium]|nr:MBOAT family O-acyltransferase [Acidobacteriota bacterium]
MIFSSLIFVQFFLPATLFTYYLTPKKYQNTLLLIASVFFYFLDERYITFFILGLIVVNHICARLIEKSHKSISKLILIIGIVLNLAPLVFLKYSSFFVDTLNQVLPTTSKIIVKDLHLPVGISFIAFQTISYLIDVYRKNGQSQKSIVNTALYILMFPQLIAGPIVRYKDVAKQLVTRVFDAAEFAYGVKRFSIGLGKKVLVANTVGQIADQIFSTAPSELNWSVCLLGVLAYTIQIYFDFSGYSDMAIGLGRMFGFKYLENFNLPYTAISIKEFWKRWHISLSSWFKDYVYVPLGGNRKSKSNTYRNLILVFILCGFWHGANWTFLIWGMLHGAFIIFEKQQKVANFLEKMPNIIRHTYVMSIVMIGWILFRSENLGYALQYMWNIITLKSDSTFPYVSFYLSPYIIIIIIAAIACSAFQFNYLLRVTDTAQFRNYEAIAAGIILIISIMQLASSTYNPFIYFRF